MNRFLALNEKAPIYLKKSALGSYYSKRDAEALVYAGLDDELKQSDRFIFSDEYTDLGDGAFLFGRIEGKEFVPEGNKTLYVETDGS